MPEDKNLVQCYNRGCGKQFDPNQNDKDECQHHPGAPVFHDAYKGWSCCNKKSVDFTEFLNIKGCTLSKHSNVKPPEPEKKALDKELEKKDVIEVRAPVVGPQLARPPFDTPMVALEARIADSLKETVQNSQKTATSSDDGNVAIGTTCKNGGCSTSYKGPQTNDTICTYHPGCPIFHEGLKFWSCCQKRTTDFNTFLNQPGCTTGSHKWTKEGPPAGTVKCRWDWHQTPEYVIISVYAKKYDPASSFIKLNPIRLNTKLVFREEGDAVFELDLELRGVINIENSSASMLPSKVEIKLKKGEPGAWSKLDFPRAEPKKEEPKPQVEKPMEDDAVDLSTVEAVRSMGQGPPAGTVKCRWDWHQTPEYVIVSVYAKKYNPASSFIKLNPIRLNTKLVFREEGDAVFELDLELRGVINIENSTASMLPSKVEIKLKKGEPGAWSKLDFPRAEPKKEEPKPQVEKPMEDDAVDLSTVEAVRSMGQVNLMAE